MTEYRGYRDLKVYQLAYRLAMEIFELTKDFPVEERYSLSDQIKRSSRSVPANIVEAWYKRRYPKMFVSKLIDAQGEAGETEVWLHFSLDFGYLTQEKHDYFIEAYAEVHKMLSGMIDKPERFRTKSTR